MSVERTYHVLLVDDELVPGATAPGSYMWYYSRAFRDHGFDVTESDGVDAAIEALTIGADRFDLVVLDVMMAPGETFANSKVDATVLGLQAGVLLADWIYKNHPNTPIVVLSVRNRATLGQLENKPNVKRVFTKRLCPPFEFVTEIKKILNQ